MKFKSQGALLCSCLLHKMQILILLLIFFYYPFRAEANSDSLDLNMNQSAQLLLRKEANLTLRDVLALLLLDNPELSVLVS